MYIYSYIKDIRTNKKGSGVLPSPAIAWGFDGTDSPLKDNSVVDGGKKRGD